MLPEQQQRILGYFIEEAKDHLNTIEQGLLNLQATIVNPEMANEVFRAAHSVKGGAAMLGIESMQRTAHRMEDYFKLLKEAPIKVDRALESMFLRVFDALQELLEQLQGPFGLTEDKEQSIMTGVEPVFQQLQEHLDQLVATAGPNEILEEAAAPVTFSTPSPQPVEESALKLVFSSDVSAALREMLARFKQTDTDESRAALEGCCQLLERFGEQFNLPTWMNLVRHARWAVCDRNNDYRTLAPVLIKEIKKAQDLVLAGREPEVGLSETLQTLAAQGDMADATADLENLFADNQPDRSSPAVVEDLPSPDFDLTFDDVETASTATDDNISIDDLLDNEIASPSGPEVGAAELTSLADLFEVGGDSLDSDWQEEEIPLNEEALSNEPLDITIAPDFEDLLNDNVSELEERPNDFESGSELADLFGDNDSIETIASSDILDSSLGVLDDPAYVLSDMSLGAELAESNEPSGDDLLGDINVSDDVPNANDLFGDLDASDDVPSADDLFGDVETSDDIPGADDLFGDVETSDDIPSADDLFGDVDDLSLGDDREERLPGLSDDSLELLGEPASPDLSDDCGNLDLELSSTDETTMPAQDNFFSEELSSEVADNSSAGGEKSEFDDFFSLDDVSPEPLETEADPLSADLWATDNAQTVANQEVPKVSNDLSEDIWGELNQPSDVADSAGVDLGEMTIDEDIEKSVQDISIGDLSLDDVWASAEDVASEDVATKVDGQSIPSDVGVEDNLFESDEAPDLTSDLELLEPDASLDIDIGDLFNENTESEPESTPDNLFTDDFSDVEEFTPLDSLDLGEPDIDLPNVDLNKELEISLNGPDASAVSDILSEPPSSDIDFDLLDLEDDGIVTGFVTPDEGIENIDAASSISEAVDHLFDQPEAEPDNQNLGELDALLSDLPADTDMAVTPSEDIENEFVGDLEALVDEPVPSATGLVESSSEASPSTDIDDEFGDLEALLQDTDQTLSTISASNLTAYRPTSNRLSSRRLMTDQTMRVSVSHLDNLSNLVGELVVNRNTLEQDQERLRQFLDNLLFQVQQLNDVGQRMRDLYERSLLESSLISSRQSYQMASVSTAAERVDVEDHATGESFDALEMDRFTGFHTLSQEMIELIVRVRESASDIAYTVESSDQVTRQFRQVTNQLQEGLNKARMVPFAQTASRLPRAVRDISLKCGKEARIVVEGRDILIDKMIVEQLYDPMTHLVNNAITHGVEMPEERRRAGKPSEGLITVRAFYQGNQTVISVGDDGAGINPDVVKQKALQKGLISQSDFQNMTVLDVYDLLFHPGFSTRDQADDFAGRGFGMDVVRTSLADIRGNITIDSELGRGTNFTIRLPLTLSISKALCCISNQARIAFPMDGVEDMFDLSRERIQKNEQGQDCILWRDNLLTFQNLSDLLSFNRTLGRGRVYGGNQDENMISIVVLRSANSFIALEVDQVMGEQEIVTKQLEGPVPKPTGIAGATVLGDGRVMPIADVLELIDLAMGRMRREPNAALWAQAEEAPPEEPAKVKSEPTVLIVDDSITVRELLSMSFNKVGYRVEQARDGQEAWEKLRAGLPCDLVFCDIEMPRMDGLELLSRLQKDGALQEIPIAMLTSRGADRHRQMAVDLGASGYFTKPYLEEALLDAANKMLHGEKLV